MPCWRHDRGFQVLLTAYPELTKQLDLDRLGLRRFEPGALVWNGTSTDVVGDPVRRPRTSLKTALAPVGTIADKLRILRQRTRLMRSSPRALLRQSDITTLSALHEEGFSDRIVERFFRPLLGGIQLDPSLGTSRRMFDVIVRSLIAGDVAVPALGMGAIPDQLSAHLPDGVIRCGAEVMRVAPRQVSLAHGATMRATRVVVAVEGPRAASLRRPVRLRRPP